MKKILVILSVPFFLGTGCKKEPTSSTQQPSPEEIVVAENIEPAFPAEIHVERYSEYGTERSTMTIDSRRTRTSRDLDIPGGVGTSESWSNVEVSVTSDAGKGRTCTIKPVILRHEDGNDVWELELIYETSTNGITTTETSKRQAMFDGLNPITVVEDESHKIILRPQTKETQ